MGWPPIALESTAALYVRFKLDLITNYEGIYQWGNFDH